ncbi:hypothetical protein BGW38_006884 [Lunasporangiospora selenospora]|uniref:F-box domain-containing protein n=1 Tax=Lunasporangiospora selenospora TaxID=979761 RepID=A0A9P6KAJ3_9FUNG|nr:hypothetical protein BGW38_006884 [Lunasporangiospora selenospora]
MSLPAPVEAPASPPTAHPQSPAASFVVLDPPRPSLPNRARATVLTWFARSRRTPGSTDLVVGTDPWMLPELLALLATYMSPRTIARCSRVNSVWRSIFEPFLYRIVTPAQLERPGFFGALQRNLHAVRTLHWDPTSWKALAPRTPKALRLLKHIGVHLRRSTASTTPASFSQFASQATQMAALTHLVVRIPSKQHPSSILLRRLPSIETLELIMEGRPDFRPTLHLEDILSAYPSLRTLKLDGCFVLSSHRHEMQAAVQTTDESWSRIWPRARTTPRDVVSSSIVSLTLRQVEISQEGLLALSPLLQRLYALCIEESSESGSFHLGGTNGTFRWDWTRDFVLDLKSHFPLLSAFHANLLRRPIPEPIIIEILTAFPALTSVGFRFGNFGTQAFKILADRCPSLETLDLGYSHIPPGFTTALIRYVRNSPHLRKLDVSGATLPVYNYFLNNVIHGEWKCEHLESLACGFMGEVNDIFAFVSRFRSLRHLTIMQTHLGIPNLDTSLELLKPCGRMESFRFTLPRDQRIKRRAIQKMLFIWPGFRTLHIDQAPERHGMTIKKWCENEQRHSVAILYP